MLERAQHLTTNCRLTFCNRIEPDDDAQQMIDRRAASTNRECALIELRHARSERGAKKIPGPLRLIGRENPFGARTRRDARGTRHVAGFAERRERITRCFRELRALHRGGRAP